MTEQELTVLKFQACTGIPMHLVQRWISNKDSLSRIDGIDIETILTSISSVGLQQYGDLIIRYLEFQRGNIDLLKDSSQKISEIQEATDKRRELKEELTNILSLIVQKHAITSCQFNTATVSGVVTEKKIIARLTSIIEKEFMANGFNVTSMTIEEAEKVYCENSDPEWFESWKQQLELYDETGQQVTFDELMPDTSYYSPATGQFHDLNYLRDEMLHVYAQEHQIARAIDKQLMTILKSEPYQVRDKGRSEKKGKVTLIAYALADLSRIDDFISRAEISGIDEITVKHTVLKVIYDSLVRFGMIEHKPASFNKDYKPHNYIKGLLKNKKKSKKFDFQMALRIKRFSTLKSTFQQS